MWTEVDSRDPSDIIPLFLGKEEGGKVVKLLKEGEITVEEVIELLKKKGIILVRTQLETGDYIFNGELAFERKTYKDLLGSMIQQKLIRQLMDMKEKYRYAVLIVEKSYIPIRRKGKNKAEINIEYWRKYGTIMHISNSLSFVLPVIRTQSKEDSVSEMLRLYEKLKKNELGVVERGIEKPTNTGDEVINFLCSIPWVGVEIASPIKKEFKNLKDFVLNYKKLREIEVSGRKLKKRATKIHKFINQKW